MRSSADSVAVVLLSPVSPDLPCGHDLEYDADFLALEKASTWLPEQQFGDTLIPAVPPDWREVEQMSLGLFARTRDLRVLAQLTHAWTETRGLDGYADGIELAAGLLEQFWEPLHPQLGIDGYLDPLPRCNAIASFTDTTSLGASVRNAPLLQWRSTPLSLRDAATVLGGVKPQPGSAPEDATQAADLRANLSALRHELGHVTRILGAFDRIHALVDERLGTHWHAATDAVERPLRLVQTAMASADPAQPSAAMSMPDASPLPFTLELDTSLSSGMPGMNLSLKARDDVMLVLEHVCTFLERVEPGHPAPLLIRRAQRLLPMTFREIIRDLAPDALGHVNLLAGTQGNGSGHEVSG